MIFACEPISDALIAEMIPLWEMHYQELHDQFYGPLNPNVEVYKKMSESDSLRIFTVREQAWLYGYQIFFVGTHPHSQQSTEATQDILYMHPITRKGMAGIQFLKWCCDYLKNEGVDVMHQRISAKNNFGKIFERMGFELADLTYSRRLQEVA